MKKHTAFFDTPHGTDEEVNLRPALGVEKWLPRTLLKAMGEPPLRIQLWDGTEIAPAGKQPLATLRVHNRRTLWRLIVNPGLNFGERYTAGELEVEGDLVEFLETIYRYRPSHHQAGFLTRYAVNRPRLPRLNTLTRARKNIHHHYDLGNDFYRLWLDEEMVYTCAYFPEPHVSLDSAQAAKMDVVCRKLRLKPGERVVEAGCGWGSLARHMARHYGVTVKAYNISREQVVAARQRAQAEGLNDQVEYIEDDYRNISGQFDVFVSVGMLEHVGTANYRRFGAVIDRCLKPDGRGLVHSIGQNEPRPYNAWCEKHIFPGAYPPTLRQMMGIFEPWGFSILDVENLRLHYAKTLQHWLTRFDHNAEIVRQRYDELFTRAWRLYLSASIANFNSGALQLFQIVFGRPQNNNIPWTRAYLYED